VVRVALVKATGRPYNNTYVGRYVIRKGRIVEYDEYFNPLVLLSAFGDAAALQKNFNIKSPGPALRLVIPTALPLPRPTAGEV
jgi:hypothetical protein